VFATDDARRELAVVTDPVLGSQLALRSVFHTIDGVRMHARVGGTGHAIVLLHPEPGDWTTYAEVMPLLAVDHTVLALDLRGHGWSDKPDGDYSVPAQASYVERFLGASGLDDAIIVGNGYGAIIAMYLASHAPTLVRGLVIGGTNAFRDTDLPWTEQFLVTGRSAIASLGPRRAVERAYRAQFADPDAAPLAAVRRAGDAVADREWVRCLRRQARALDYDDVESLLPSIRQPALLVWGRQDRVTELGLGQRLQAMIGAARLSVLERCGHYAPLERPDAFAALTAEFCKAI
jgi:pimeloyl-ACP methyl ester carboxylesterase